MSILSNVEEELLPELPRFFENYESDLEQLKQDLDDRNAEGIESTVHRIKGSSGSWGFEAIQQAAVELEDAAQARDWEAIKSTLSELEAQIKKAQEAVEEELEST